MAEKQFHRLDKTRIKLPRVLALGDVMGIVIGSVIGSGIFIVPATIAASVKSPLWILIVWFFGGVLSFFGALTFSELGALYPQAGGMYVYLKETYGQLVAFLFGWTLFLVIDSGSIATLSVAFSSKYLPYFIPLSPLASKIIAVGFIAFLVTVNYIGVKWGALLQNFLTVIKFFALLVIAFTVFLVGKGNFSHFVHPAPEPLSPNLIGNLGIALVACLWAYKGWEIVTFSAGEIKNPQKNLTFGLLIGTLSILFIYILINLAYLYVFPAQDIAKSSRIASDVMKVTIGSLGATVIAIIILFSITGSANANVLTSPRVFFAMARDGYFFKNIALVHPRFLTPYSSILITGLWSSILCLSGTFEQLFSFVIFGQWIFFGLTAGSVLILRKKKPRLSRSYRTWGYPFTPLIFIMSAIFISLNSLINQFWNSMAGLIIILLGIPVFNYWKSKKKPPGQRKNKCVDH